MNSDSMFAETTNVPAARSISEIMGVLAKMGAVSVNQELDGGRVVGLSFVIAVAGGRLPFKLPVRTEQVFARINARRPSAGDGSRGRPKKTREQAAAEDQEQAERIAWRQLYWWLKAQFALIDLGMVQASEVMMPYALGADGRTLYESLGPKLIAGAK